MMRAYVGVLVLLLCEFALSATLRGNDHKKITNAPALNPEFLEEQASTGGGAAPTAAPAAAPANTATPPATPAPTDSTGAATPPASSATGSVADVSSGTGVSNADLAAQQAKLNSIEDQITSEQQKLDSIHAATLVTNPEFTGPSTSPNDLTNTQVDDLTKQVLGIPNLQAQDDKAKAASCAAGGASGSASGAGGAPAAGGAAAGGAATGAGGGSSVPSDADIAKKHQEFATLIKHAQQAINEVAAMPYLGQNSDAEASALSCGASSASGSNGTPAADAGNGAGALSATGTATPPAASPTSAS